MTSNGDDLEILEAQIAALAAALVTLSDVAKHAPDGSPTRASLRATLHYLDTEGEQLLQEIVRLATAAQLGRLTVSGLRSYLTSGTIEIVMDEWRRRESEVRVAIVNERARRPLRRRTPTRRSGHEPGQPQESAGPGRLAGIAVALGAGVLAGIAAGPLVALLIKESIVKKAVEGAITGLFATAATEAVDAWREPPKPRPRLSGLSATKLGQDSLATETGSPAWNPLVTWSPEVTEYRQRRDFVNELDEATTDSTDPAHDNVIDRGDHTGGQDTP